jgi:hypothetical protein
MVVKVLKVPSSLEPEGQASRLRQASETRDRDVQRMLEF